MAGDAIAARVVIGLGYGDEGKGSWVDHLVRAHHVPYVVRFNGGPQAAHNVVTEGGRHHCFAQFGSGALLPFCRTILSRFMLIDPQYLGSEARTLEQSGAEDPLGRLLVSENSPVITPFNRLFNRILETARGAERHGSCGYGVGVTQGDVETRPERALYVRDLRGPKLLDKLVWLSERRLAEAQPFGCDANRELLEQLGSVDLAFYSGLYREFSRRVRTLSDDEIGAILRENDTVFEGAQGVLLDQQYGFFPYCTRSNCSFENAETLLKEAGFSGRTERIGLLRGYATRHGAGPLVSEDAALRVSECHNGANPWQGRFRLGWFDAVTARYALEAVGGVDTLAITNLDRMQNLEGIRIASSYEHDHPGFFSPSGERMYVRKMDLGTLAARSKAMEHIAARYEECPGFRGVSEPAVSRYLERIERLIERRVEAASLTPSSEKIYR